MIMLWLILSSRATRIKLEIQPGILYTNADQFVNKINDLEMLVSGSELDLLLISRLLRSLCQNELVHVLYQQSLFND